MKFTIKSHGILVCSAEPFDEAVDFLFDLELTFEEAETLLLDAEVEGYVQAIGRYTDIEVIAEDAQ